MLKLFLLTYNPAVVSQAAMTAYFDKRSEIKNWHTFMAGSALIVSDANVHSLQNAIHLGFPTMNFLVAEVDGKNMDGWMPKATWQFAHSPQTSTPTFVDQILASMNPPPGLLSSFLPPTPPASLTGLTPPADDAEFLAKLLGKKP